ncbi:uncharacterized protein I303_101864 [Kwoniella dejecticola CBS 10117]|uniref:F-box domain-containing protein n=1 Tax=Kwoniella dejecticola CBS 10117 TaxID=1296121 RepID=A0A1A6ACJ0_9TREE|nr:uncharacterized protein I303_02000 [Kwoniella dejecticola CBS 10117]OBR87787.1 hypothetical protein I303_02000 [Kwoniella dejecticola CBS 10117]
MDMGAQYEAEGPPYEHGHAQLEQEKEQDVTHTNLPYSSTTTDLDTSSPVLNLDLNLNLDIDPSSPLSSPLNIPAVFNFMIQHLSLTSYLPASSLLVLQRVSWKFFHLITPLFYRRLIIDLKDARNPTSISPFHFYPNPIPRLSRFKTLCFRYAQHIEFSGSHAAQCHIFNDQLGLPKLQSVRLALPAGKYKSFCGKEMMPTQTQSWPASSDPNLPDHGHGHGHGHEHGITHQKEDIQCDLLRSIKTHRLIIEVERFGRLDVFARRDFFEHDELIVRIGRVGEDAMLGAGEGAGWPIFEEQLGRDNRGRKRNYQEQGDEDMVENENENDSSSRGAVKDSTSDTVTASPAGWITSLNLTPSLKSNNVVPNLTIIFLSPGSSKLKIAKPILSDDKRSDTQRVNHHLIALSCILAVQGLERVKLVNCGVLLFPKYGVKREIDELLKMQDEVIDILCDLADIQSGSGTENQRQRQANHSQARIKEQKQKQDKTGGVGIMSKVQFELLDDYLKEEKRREEQLTIKAKAGQKGKRTLY